MGDVAGPSRLLATADGGLVSPSHSHSISPPALEDAQIPRASCAPHPADTPNTNDRYPPNSNTALNTVGTHDSPLPPPPRAIVPVQPLAPNLEIDSWPINQYIVSDPRFRDSTLVFPRIRPLSSWPFWHRHRVAILTALASFVALAFVLVAIIGSITIKNE
jgi:hypothetical protein